MSRFLSAATMRAATITLAGVALATAAVAIGVSAGTSTTPPPPASSASPLVADPTPVPTPRVSSTPAPSSIPVASPAIGDSDPKPRSVRLDNVDRDVVTVAILDRTGTITAAGSGHPGDGASVASYTLDVENVDSRTLLLRWTDFPIDNQLTLFVDEVDGRLRLGLVQPPPTGPTDTVAFDRELVLTFDHDVDASSVEAILQDGLDT